MKKSRLYILLTFLFSFATVTAYSGQLASAKVLSVNGTAHSYTQGGPPTTLTAGTILTQGDSVTTAALSNVMLVFSNGSELTIEENTSITLAELSQQTFIDSKRYEQLQADPSKSQVRLELNYGTAAGHVKKLRTDSTFNIETVLGTAAILGTQFSVEIRYNAERGELILIIHNKDGKVDVISRYTGNFEYGRGNVGDKGYESALLKDNNEAIPPAHIIIIRLSEQDPRYHDIVDSFKNNPPFKNSRTQPQIDSTQPGPIVTPEDQNVTIPSNNLPS